jgi:hypothetical protein
VTLVGVATGPLHRGTFFVLQLAMKNFIFLSDDFSTEVAAIPRQM